MSRSEINIRTRLLESGREEFLRRGFEGASLRSICRNAGLTTGAFYSNFSRKEDLFSAIVDGMLAEFHEMYGSVIEEELIDIAAGSESELTSITYLAAHRDEFRLLFECSAGTKYEGFRDYLINDVFMPSYQAVFDRYAGTPVDPALVRIILGMKFEEYMELIYGGYSMEKIKSLIGQLTVFSMTGFQGLMEELKKEQM